jgi:DNA replication protein DnaC
LRFTATVVDADADALRSHLIALNLPFMRENHQALAQTAADKHWSHLDYLTELLGGKAAARDDRRVHRCIKLARFPAPRPSTNSTGTGPPR